MKAWVDSQGRNKGRKGQGLSKTWQKEEGIPSNTRGSLDQQLEKSKENF